MSSKMKNLTYALTANIITLFMGVVTGFLIPMFFTIEDYAYFKLFLFYVGYVGILHWGILDGIYIKYGAYDYEDLPKEKFRRFFRATLIMQVIESIVVAAIILYLVKDNNRVFIFVSVMVNMILVNLTTLFAYIHQFTRRVKLFSVNLILTKLIFILGCLSLFAFHIYQYKLYIVVQTLTNLIVLLIYFYYNKDLVVGKSEAVFKNIKEYSDLLSIGFFVMVGNLMSVIIIGLDRIVIDRFFTTVDFSMYSFAYTLVALFYTLLNAVTMIIYPYLARSKKEELGEIYVVVKDILIIITTLMIAGYFVIEFIVRIILPKYIDALTILRALIPTIILSSQINILISNIYKVLELKKDYPKNNIFALVLGVITNAIAYFIFRTPLSIAIATLISFIIWVVYSDRYFEKKLNINVKGSNVIQILSIILFLICAYTLPWLIGLVVYLILLSLMLLFYYKNKINGMLKLIFSK